MFGHFGLGRVRERRGEREERGLFEYTLLECGEDERRRFDDIIDIFDILVVWKSSPQNPPSEAVLSAVAKGV